MQFVGRVAAIDKVDLRARVTGFLERGSSSLPRALFVEGADVKKGDLLYVIEQPPFQAQVAAAKGQVAQAEANVAEANATLQRVQEAVTSGAVSKQELDQATAAAQEGQAQVLVAKAQLQTAEINLGYTEIYAPISGKIGMTTFTFGNLVGPDSGVLATIVSQDPIYVTFPVSAAVIAQVQDEASGALPPPDSFVVRVELPDGTMYRAARQDRLPQQSGRSEHRHAHGARRVRQPRAPSDRRPVRHGDRRDGRAGDGAGRAAAGRADRPGRLLRPGGGQRRQGRAAARHAGSRTTAPASWCRAG